MHLLYLIFVKTQMESELYETLDNPQTSEDTNCKRKYPKITLYTQTKEIPIMMH